MKFVQSSSYEDTVICELRRQLRLQATEWFKVIRSDVVITPTTKVNSIISLRRPRTWKQFVRLIMVHWYLPESIFAFVHLELSEYIYKYGTDKVNAAQALLRSEPEMVLYLMNSSAIYKTERELFGDILESFQFSQFYFRVLEPHKAKKKVFRRGYDDQGSRRLPHEQHEAKFDWSYTEEQLLIEERRQILEDTNLLIKGFVE